MYRPLLLMPRRKLLPIEPIGRRGRGRPPGIPRTPLKGRGLPYFRQTETAPGPSFMMDEIDMMSPCLDVPDIAGEEQVVLNRRGTPARQPKRNRLYYDDDDEAEVDIYGIRNKEKGKDKKASPDRREVVRKERNLEKDKIKPKTIHSTIIRGDRGARDKNEKSRAKKIKVSGRSSKMRAKVKLDFGRKRSPVPERKPKKKIKAKKPLTEETELVNLNLEDENVKRELFLDDVTPIQENVSEETVVEEIDLESTEDWSPKCTKNRSQSDGCLGLSIPSPLLGTPLPNYTSFQPIEEFPTPEVRHAIDKKTAQEISLRLRNLLKLPKAHKWVCYEWFYSNIDKVLFAGENDFQICLKESFPQFRAKKLTRVEWCKIRRMMGKPRRCSQSFFDEEREELYRRRQKIRMIQQRKVTDFNYKELPDEIPLQLVIGTKVTARLRRPQDGLFTGTIDAVDTSNNTYRITFDRTGLGTHSIPDYEVLSNEPPETVSTSSFALKIPRRVGPYGSSLKFQNSALLADDGIFGMIPKSPFPVDGLLGGFPIRLLDMIVRLSKLLKAKREKISHLKELNVEAEKMKSYGTRFNDDFRIRYAKCVLDLDSMNKEMSLYLDGIQTYCLEQIAPDHGANLMIVPEHIQEQCKQEAQLIVDSYNTKNNRNLVYGRRNINLIASLCSLLLQVKTLSSGDRNLYELKSIKDTLNEIKNGLESKNVQYFQNKIELSMNRIQAGLTVSQPSKPF